MNATKAACRALCQSGKFETGQGTCAPICMEFLLAEAVLRAAAEAQ